MSKESDSAPEWLVPKPVEALTGDEPFAGSPLTVADFWRWAFSDLRTNVTRGILAEYLVAQAVGDPSALREAWDNWDVTTATGVKVEVKSSAYLQSWKQRKLSSIVFTGLTGRAWSADTNEMDAERSLRADVYVFALHTCREPDQYDALNLEHWQFRVLTARKLGQHKVRSVSLAFLEVHAPTAYTLGELREAVQQAHDNAQADEVNPAIVGSEGSLPRRQLQGLWWVPGMPVTFAGGERERQWRETVAAFVPAATSVTAHTGLTLEFVIADPRKQDLDNLAEPVLSTVINRNGWFGGRRPNLVWLALSKESGAELGCTITPLEESPDSWMPDTSPLLDETFPGPLPRSATGTELAAWISERCAAGGDARYAVALRFAGRKNLGEVATGGMKPILDCLWPLLGGTPGAPEDWRIDRILLTRGADDIASASAEVRIWQL